MLGAEKGQAVKLDGSQLRIGIVQARFNEGITERTGSGLQERAAGARRGG
jgi:6,7-dimethyl-8-ribityllumazine synthase